MPAAQTKRTHQHTAKAERMAQHIAGSAKREGRYKGREKTVAWAKVHKELPAQAHPRRPRARRSRRGAAS